MIYTKKAVIATGNFDGVHLAHQAIIKECVRLAKEQGLLSLVITYQPHPRNVFGRENILDITSLEEKKNHIMSMGADILYVMESTPKLLSMKAHHFAEEFLVKRFNAGHVLCGYDFKFGHQRAGDVELLKRIGQEHGFSVRAFSRMTLNGDTISSSNIREAAMAGQIKRVNAMLGRCLSYQGTITAGHGMGAKHGVPTANIPVDDNLLLPRFGVYKTRVHMAGRLFDSITNIGVAPTLKNGPRLIETHIFDYECDIYGEDIILEILDFIRPEQKFPSREALVRQIERDVKEARRN